MTDRRAIRDLAFYLYRIPRHYNRYFFHSQYYILFQQLSGVRMGWNCISSCFCSDDPNMGSHSDRRRT